MTLNSGAAELGGALPDHLSVVTDDLVVLGSVRLAIPVDLFGEPAVHQRVARPAKARAGRQILALRRILALRAQRVSIVTLQCIL